MSKYIIKVRNEDDGWLWSSGDWKDYVCEDFDENVVLIANRNHDGVEEATWWNDACHVLDGIDNSNDIDEAVETLDNVSPDKVRDAWHYYSGSRDSDNDALIAIAKILYPWLKLKATQLSSYHEYQNAVYVSDIVDGHSLQDWWSGDVYDVRVYEVSDEDIASVEDDNMSYDDICDISSEIDGMYFTCTHLWDVKRNPQGYKAGMAEEFGIPAEDIYDIVEE